MRRGIGFLLLLGGLLGGPAGAVAQRAPDATSAEPYLDAEHWSRAALRRLAGLGVIDASAATMAWPASRARVRALLERAADGGGSSFGSPASAPRTAAAAYLERFRQEFGAATGDRAPAATAWMAGGWAAERGRMLAGAMLEVSNGYAYPGPVPVAAASRPVTLAGAEVATPFGLAASAEVGAFGSEARLESAVLSWSRGPVDVWAGRRALAIGGSPGGGMVLSGGTTFDGAGIALAQGRRLPGFLGAVGPVRATLMIARMERSGAYEHPWFAAARVELAPARSLSIGLNRATLFGGGGNEGVTPERVALMAIGLTDIAGKDSDFENQVASADLLWRVRPGGTPALLYGEWAFDDVGGAWFSVPGVILGAEVPAVPGAHWLSAGLEHVWVDRSCCGHPPWYRHGALAEGWTDRGRLLGHPLGGHGRQTSLLLRAALPGAGVLAGGRAFLRDRGPENLFAPDRTGGSVGGRAWLTAFLLPRVRLRTEAEVERGDAWWTGSVRVRTEVRF